MWGNTRRASEYTIILAVDDVASTSRWCVLGTSTLCGGLRGEHRRGVGGGGGGLVGVVATAPGRRLATSFRRRRAYGGVVTSVKSEQRALTPCVVLRCVVMSCVVRRLVCVL
jgi:hypothetical protein